MLYLTGYLSRGTNTIHSGLAEDSVSSGSLDWLQVKEKLWFRNPECKPLHTTIHPAQAAAETQLLLELRLSSSWSMCPTRLCLCFLLTSSYLTPTHTICIHAYVYPPPWSDQGDFRKTYRIYIHTYTHVGFPGDSDSKESTCSARDTGSIPELGRSPAEGSGNPLQCSCLGNIVDRGAWWATVRGVAKSRTQLSETNTFISHVCMQVCLRMVMSIMTLKDSNQYTTNPFDLTTNPFPWTTLFTILIVGVRKPPPPMRQTWPLPVKLYWNRASLMVLFIVSGYFHRRAEQSWALTQAHMIHKA